MPRGERPPDGIQIALRVFVEGSLEPVHDENPAGEDEKLGRPRCTQSSFELVRLVRRDVEHLLEPLAVAGQSAEQERRGLGRHEVRVA